MKHKMFRVKFLWLLVSLFCLPAAYSDSLRIASESEALKIMSESDNLIRRRAAYRFLLNSKNDRDTVIKKALSDKDPIIRRNALFEVFCTQKGDASPELIRMVKDPDPGVMDTLIACAKNLKPKKESITILEAIAANSVVPQAKAEAKRLTSFTLYRENKRLCDNPTHDYDIITLQSIPLPLQGWKFKLDPLAKLHEENVFAIDFDASGWKKIDIGYWEEQGYNGYDGIAWYRICFKMPPRPECNAVELFFRGVDESAWVWLNGQYIGQRDIGVPGWNIPFYLDVGKEIKWNAENVLVVRVEDTCFGGGIWKPVSVEILK